MQDDANEFVFKRKRKRLRIDAQDTDQASDGGLIPEITVLSQPAISSPAFPDNPISPRPSPSPAPEARSESVVTVEKFLRSVQPVSRAKQATSSAVSVRRPRAYIRRRPAERRTTPVRKAIKVPKRPRESPRIAKVLFRAAVLTGGDPLDTLANGAGISHTRRPLKFVPFNESASPFESGRTRANLDHGGDAVPHARHLDPSDLKAHHHHSSSCHPRVPLCLVPLREAEAAYSIIFPRGTRR